MLCCTPTERPRAGVRSTDPGPDRYPRRKDHGYGQLTPYRTRNATPRRLKRVSDAALARHLAPPTERETRCLGRAGPLPCPRWPRLRVLPASPPTPRPRTASRSRCSAASSRAGPCSAARRSTACMSRPASPAPSRSTSAPRAASCGRELRKGDTLVAAKLDRMFRSASDCLAVVEAFKARGVTLFLLDLNGGADDVSGNGIARLFLTIVAAFAEFERDRIGERIRATKQAQKARGEYLGGRPPFGFVYDADEAASARARAAGGPAPHPQARRRGAVAAQDQQHARHARGEAVARHRRQDHRRAAIRQDRECGGVIHTEQTKLLATAFNNLGVGAILAGVIVPNVIGTVADVAHVAAWVRARR